MDNYDGEGLHKLIQDHLILSAEGNAFSKPRLFNLMFETQRGPAGQFKGFLRLETAQGHFINFKKLLEHNNDRMPFASASIGKSFRNEISPRQGLLRVRYVCHQKICLLLHIRVPFLTTLNPFTQCVCREFTMAEIEHFVNPEDKKHSRFNEVRDVLMTFYTAVWSWPHTLLANGALVVDEARR